MRRALLIVGLVVAGLIVLSAVAGLASNGRDNTGETVRAERWADDVCGTVGAWEGQLKGIREELRHNNWAARRSDGSTGDSQEQVVTVHDAVNRAMRATQETLQEGLKRAGIPSRSRSRPRPTPPTRGPARARPRCSTPWRSSRPGRSR